MNSDSAEFLHSSDVFIYFGTKTTAMKIWDYFTLINTPPVSQDGVHSEATVLFRNHPREDIHCEHGSDARWFSCVPICIIKVFTLTITHPCLSIHFSGKILPCLVAPWLPALHVTFPAFGIQPPAV